MHLSGMALTQDKGVKIDSPSSENQLSFCLVWLSFAARSRAWGIEMCNATVGAFEIKQN